MTTRLTSDTIQPEGDAAPATRPINRLLQWALVAGLIGVILAAYAPVFREWVRDWIRDPNYSHGFIIPVISGFLLWRKRREIQETPRSPSIVGAVGLLLAAALLILGSAGAEVFTQRVSFVGLLLSLTLFLFSWRHLRLTAFPIALLLLAIPLPYVIYYGLTAPLQALAAKCAIVGLRVIGVPAASEGNIIHLANTSLEVAEACSGIRSLYAFVTLGALAANFTPIPWWGRVTLLLAVIPLSVAGNALRVWGTGVGAYLFGPEVAEGTIHELFGLLVIGASLGILLLFRGLARRLWSSDSLSQS